MLSVEQVAACGVVPVVVLEDAEQAVPTAKALLKGGITAMEITFRTAAAKASIAKVAAEVPEMIVGAGTVINVQQLHDAVEAGAKFIVDKVGAAATVVALPVPTSGSVSELRMAGFNETIAEIAPELNVIEYATKFTREDGLKDFADILAANPQIDAVYSLDDETSIGVLQAIADAGRTDIKAITGGGGCQEYFQLIAENKDIAVSSSLYSPLMIRDCFDVALAKLAGEDVETVTVIPSQIVDASNVEEYLDPSNTIY